MLFNANLDRSPALRQSMADLRHDLKRWELTVKGKVKEEVLDVTEYQVCMSHWIIWLPGIHVTQRANKTHFAQLTELARPRKPVPNIHTDSAHQDAALRDRPHSIIVDCEEDE